MNNIWGMFARFAREALCLLVENGGETSSVFHYWPTNRKSAVGRKLPPLGRTSKDEIDLRGLRSGGRRDCLSFGFHFDMSRVDWCVTAID